MSDAAPIKHEYLVGQVLHWRSSDSKRVECERHIIKEIAGSDPLLLLLTPNPVYSSGEIWVDTSRIEVLSLVTP